MPKLFFRTAPNTIKDALELTEDAFISKYSDTTASEHSLSSAFKEIRKHHKPESKEVVFKVIQTDEKVKAITTPVIPKGVKVADIPEDEANEIIRDVLIHETPLTTEQENKLENFFNKDELTKRKVGRQPFPEAEKRNARILELLKAGHKGTHVYDIMIKEGYTVHAPQITRIKKENGL